MAQINRIYKDIQVMTDNQTLSFGAAQDVSIVFDGSDMIIASENITANDELLFVGFDYVHTDSMYRQASTWHAYGGFQDAVTTITVGADDTWYHITNVGNNLWTGLEGDGLTLSGDVMTFTNGGDYIGSLAISISALTGKDYHIRLYNVTQTTQMGYYIGVSTTGAGNQVVATMPLYIEATAGDEMRMEIECETSATDVVVDNAVFYLAYLHD